MNANTFQYLIGVPILLLLEAWFLIVLVNLAKEKSLKLLSALYVVVISSMCLSGIGKLLTPYTGMFLAFGISLLIVYIFIYGYLTENVHLTEKSAVLIAAIYLVIDLIAKASFAFFAVMANKMSTLPAIFMLHM